MRRIIILTMTAILGSISMAAQAPPPVADNANISDRSLKDRSIEMERVRREDSKGVVTGKPGEPIAETKFNEIKEDFEQIQVTQSAIVAAYQTAKTIDYKLIATAAEQVGNRGTRLNKNLFPPVVEKVEKKKKEKEKKLAEPVATVRVLPNDMKTIIAEMDNTLALFVANAMFSNARVANVEDHARARSDLEHVIALSGKLKEMATAQVPVTK